MEKTHSIQKKTSRGFSLVELLVATALFTTVVAVSAGSFLSILEASRQSRELNELMLAIDFAMEDMSRTIRTGSDFEILNGSTPVNSGGSLNVIDEDGNRVHYARSVNRLIKRSDAYASFNWLDFTPEDITISHLTFTRESPGTNDQPRIIINIAGQLGSDPDDTFYLQTSVTQRELNIAP